MKYCYSKFPPSSPEMGDTYLNHRGDLYWYNGQKFVSVKSIVKPLVGEISYDEDDEMMYVWDGEGWRVISNISEDEIEFHKTKSLERKYKRAMSVV